MPATGVYTRQRRIAMQATMLAVLALAVGLAALLDRHVQGGSELELGTRLSLGNLHVRFPKGWRIGWTNGEPSAVVAAESQSPLRSLTLYSEHWPPGESAKDYLDNSDILTRIFDDPDNEADIVGTGTLAGFPAICVEGSGSSRMGARSESKIVLCAMLPHRQALTLCLSKHGALTASDDALLDEVAASVAADSSSQ